MLSLVFRDLLFCNLLALKRIKNSLDYIQLYFLTTESISKAMHRFSDDRMKSAILAVSVKLRKVR